MHTLTFSRKDLLVFLIALIFVAIGYACMVLDPAANGFGLLTLWIAPPMLLTGFLLAVKGISGVGNLAATLLKRILVNKWKYVFSFLVFIIAFVVYLNTLEPTASLWDCSEFIATAYKLQIPHTPGTPLLLLIARMFTMLSLGDVQKVAWTVNLMSGLFSALSVSLTYHVIYYFGERIISASARKPTRLLIVSAAAGSLCLAFSDTFWFSAVEAETYAAACFFMALTGYLILKGSTMSGVRKARMLVLVSYLTGLSYCIHPMCVLIAALLPFTWYVENKKVTIINSLLGLLCGLMVVLAINRLIAVGIFEMAFTFDLFFVNKLHWPFCSGVVVFVILLAIAIFFLLKKLPNYSTHIYSVIFLFLGFTPYLLLFIRSQHNPPIDEFNPENLQMIKAYMNRENYPSNPLLYGPYFDSAIRNVSNKKPVYVKEETNYKITGHIPKYHYDPARQTIFPRMYSHNTAHIEAYRKWTGLRPHEKPTFYHNLEFLFSYQLGHMYLRYLMWNFAGRESDIMNSGWLTPWEGLKSSIHESKAHNQYWMLPFVLGLFGMFFQYKRDRKNFAVNTMLFLVTGIILILYLNPAPNEPRERDYIFVGSYMAFCMWIGLGMLALVCSVKNGVAFWLAAIFIVSVPAWIYYQNIDDHNRSGRSLQVDYARIVLNSCAPGSILFTGGDNDTFPLWYLQEVEGFRTDVRVVVLSYFNTDWYINQLRKPYYKSAPFRLTLAHHDYYQYGPNDVLYLNESIKEGIDVKKFIQLLKEGHPALKKYATDGDVYHIVPSSTLTINVEKNIEAKNSTLQDPAGTNGRMVLHLKENYLEKNVLAMLDLITSNDWERPVYFNFTSATTLGLTLDPYLVQEGQVFRLSPVASNEKTMRINKEATYRNLIENADYSNLIEENTYFTYEDHFARIIVPLRQSFNDLAEAYIKDGDIEKAKEVMFYSIDKLYHAHLWPAYSDLRAASLLLFLEEKNLARSLAESTYQFYYSRVLENINEPDEASLYIAEGAAKLLYKLGEQRYLDEIAALK